MLLGLLALAHCQVLNFGDRMEFTPIDGDTDVLECTDE